MILLDISQNMADNVRYLLLALLILFVIWSAFSSWLTFRNFRQMSAGQGRNRTRWICQIFVFLTIGGVFDILLTSYRVGKTMSDYLFVLYAGQALSYCLIVISATGFMLSLFGASLRRVVREWLKNE